MEMAEGTAQGIDTSANTMGAQSAPPVAEERTFRQSEVSDIVKRAKHDAVDSYRRMQVDQPEYLQRKYGDTPTHDQVRPQTGTGDEHYRKIVAEEMQRSRDEWAKDAQTKTQTEQAQKTLANFFTKVSQGREKYQDFDKVTNDIEIARFPNVIQLLGDHIENASDILYELGKDRIKLSNLEQLAQLSPRDAVIQAQRLAQSIKDNQAAAGVRVPNEPLSQLRPTNTGTDSGKSTVGDLRKKYRV